MTTRVLQPFLWIAIFLTVVEIAFEYRAHRRGWDTFTFGDLSDQLDTGTANDSSGFGRTEGFPFRSRIVPAAKPVGSTRIWLASASYGEDSYLPPEVIFPHLLSLELATTGTRVQVLNAARAGTSITGNLRELVTGFETWRPDIVILYQLSLDLDQLSRRYAQGSTRVQEDVVAANAAAPLVAPSWASRLVEHTTLYELLHGNVTSRLVGMRILPDRLASVAEDAFQATLIEFIQMVRSRGAEPVLCTFATSRAPGDTTPVSPDVALFVHRWNEALSAPGWLAAVDDLNGVIRKVANQENVALVDVAARISGRTSLFRDPVHFTLEGHREVASVLAAGLVEHARTIGSTPQARP